MSLALYKKDSLFLFGGLFNKALPFLLLPILTKYLTPDEYGMITNYMVIVTVLSIIVGLSVQAAQSVNYYNQSEEERKKYLFNLLILLFLSLSVVMLPLFLMKSWIASKMGIPELWVICAVFHSTSMFLTALNLDLWRLEHTPIPYVLYEFSQVSLDVGLSLFFVISLHMKADGRQLGLFSAVGLFGLLSLVFIVIRKKVIFKIEKKYIIDAFKFGAPLILHRFSSWIRMHLDKLIITSFLGMTTLGIYSLGFQVGSVSMIIFTILNKIISPYLFKVLSENELDYDLKHKIVKWAYLMFLVICILSILFAITVKLGFPLFFDEKFQNSEKYIYWVLLGNVFCGCYFVVVNFLFYIKKTMVISKVTFFVSGVHILLLYPLTMKLGPMGGVYTYISSMFLMFVLTWYFSNKHFKLPWFNFLNRQDSK